MVVRNLPHRLLIGNNTLPKLHNVLAGWSKLTSPVGLGHPRLQASSSGSGAPFPINSGDIVVTRVMLSSGWTTGSQDIKGRHMMSQALMQNWLAYSFYHISLLKPVPRQGCSGRHLPSSRANKFFRVLRPSLAKVIADYDRGALRRTKQNPKDQTGNFVKLVKEVIRSLSFPRGSPFVPAMQETCVQSLGREDPLEKGMITHSSILTWRIPWTEEPGRLQTMESQSWIRVSN